MTPEKEQHILDAEEIIRRITSRNPDFIYLIKSGSVSLEEFARVIISQYDGFHRRKAGK